jgi:hypothetical protein
MNSSRLLFGSFPPPSRQDWLQLSGSDFTAALEPGLTIPGLLARSLEDDQSLDRSILFKRDPGYRDSLSVRTDPIDVPSAEFAAHAGYKQIGLRKIVSSDFLEPLSARCGIHLTTDELNTGALSLALNLAGKHATGSFAASDPSVMLRLLAPGSPALSSANRDDVWMRQGGFRLLGINLRDNSNSVITRTVTACAWIHRLVNAGSLAGLDAQVVAKHLSFSVPLSNSFWLEIAFLRSLRVLIEYTLRKCGVAEPPPALITAVVPPATSSDDTSRPELELIRYSAIASAAMLGGADMISGPGLDVVSGADDRENQRMLASTQLALVHEAGLARHADPAGGGYYVELLSQKIAVAAWDVLAVTDETSLRDESFSGLVNEPRPDR